MPAIANGIRTDERALAIQPTPIISMAVSVINMPIANAVKDAQSIFACFSVGGGIVILINFP
jgi:hypothetical protein